MKRTYVVTGVGLALLSSAVCLAAVFPSTDLFLPMVGRNPGVPPSQWYTKVWAYNPNDTAVEVTFALLERNRSNLTPRTFTETLQPLETKAWDDAMQAFFGRNAWGAIRVIAPLRVAVTERFYSITGSASVSSAGASESAGDPVEALGAAERGSVGQDFAGIPASFAIGPGESTEVLGVYQTQPAADSDFRFNYGFVETAGGSGTVRVSVKDAATGAERAHRDAPITPFEQKQLAFKDIFPAISTANARLTVEVIAGTCRVIPYGTSIANGSQDPTTHEALRLAELGTVTEVRAGQGLTGGGSSGVVNLDVGAGAGISVAEDTVAIADGGVTSAMIANGTITGTDVSTTAQLQVQRLRTGGVPSGAAGADAPLYARNNGASGEAAYFLTGDPANPDETLWVGNWGGGNAIEAAATGGYGVRASSAASNGYGVYGIGNGATGSGVVGSSAGENGRGVWGSANGANGVGVYGNRGGNWGSLGSLGYGVQARSTTVAAVYGENTSAHTSAYLGGENAVFGINEDGSGGILAGELNGVRFGVHGGSDYCGVQAIVRRGTGAAVIATNQQSGTQTRGEGYSAVRATNPGSTAVLAEGDLVVEGEYRGNHGPNHGAPFPRPAFDSGFIALAQNESLEVNHGIGGDEYDYVVDLTFRSDSAGISIIRHGLDGNQGATWAHLTNESITVHRGPDDVSAPRVRVRIWVIGS